MKIASAGAAIAVNNKNEVVGSIEDGDRKLGFMWSAKGGLFDLNPPSFDSSEAVAINDESAVLVNAKKGGRDRAFIWSEENGFSEIIAPKGSRISVRSINNNGFAVGTFWDEKGHRHAFMWSKNEGFFELSENIPNEFESMARAINNQGEVLLHVWDDRSLFVEIRVLVEKFLDFPERWKITEKEKERRERVIIWSR